VHDTVVIFDRVRENLSRASRGDSFEGLVNQSIQQSLARSIKLLKASTASRTPRRR